MPSCMWSSYKAKFDFHYEIVLASNVKLKEVLTAGGIQC